MILYWPLAPEHRRITQHFGEDPKRYGQWGLDGHPGVDFGVPIGIPVLAANEGELQVAWGPQLGWQCWVVTNWGQTFYAHLDSTRMPRRVRAREIIARSGNTGTETTGPHLHFEVHPFPRDMTNGFKGAIDPLPLLQEGERIMSEALEAAKGVRWRMERRVRWRKEAKAEREQAAALIRSAELKEARAALEEEQEVNLKNGAAYLPEILLGGDKPAEWEG